MRTLSAAFLFYAVCLSSVFAPAVVGQERSRSKVLPGKAAPLALALESSQSTIAGPPSSGTFGAAVAVLPNGNIVVADPSYDGVVTDGGAVHLYNGSTLAPISSLTGGTVGDQVGSGGITVLSNGNFVVRSPNWDGPGAVNAGAVTFGNASTGFGAGSVPVGAGNSLVGTTASDVVGSGGVTALTNGNYVVSSQNWGATDLGAATFGNGTTGTSGAVGAGNSIIGSSTDDLVSGGGITALTNGNYVVNSPNWGATDVGAATWGNGTTGTAVTVAAGNSLVGSTANDFVSSGSVTALSNGNYVVSSPMWDNGGATDAGAATWGNGATGTSGAVAGANSIVGSVTGDMVGSAGVTALLTNGNYVVRSPAWNNGGATDAGAATWANGAGPTSAIVAAANSLVGSTTNDNVSGAGVTALTNGNYVVRSPAWNNGGTVDAGAATFGSGASGISGAVSAANSLVGTTASDLVSLGSLAALSNGNYVVGSPNWAANDIGAVTWGDGTTGTVGSVSAGNSIIGVTANDNVGGVTALSNGNYVINSPNWDGGAVNVGAVTWVNGSASSSGTVTAGNSLTGTSLNDNVGGGGITALTNGNYVVRSQNWDGSAVNTGAVTWGSGTAGSIGTVSSSNSLVGSVANDQVGSGGITALSNGNYAVRSPNWDNGATLNAGAVTYGAGNGVTTVGPISTTHSVLGTVANGTLSIGSAASAVSLERLAVGRPSSNAVTLINPSFLAVANGNWDAASTWDYGQLTQAHDVVIPSGSTVALNTNIPAGGTLTINSGGTLSLSGNRSTGIPITNNGTIDLTGGKLTMGANLLSLGCTGTFSGANTNGYVIGTVLKTFCATGPFSFAIGTVNGFSAVDVIVTTLTTNPSTLTMFATGTVRAGLFPAASLQRFWTITETGDLTADLTFHYNDIDVAGPEGTYKLFRVVGPTFTPVTFVLNTGANTISTTGVTTFSDWAVGNTTPTAGTATVSGRVVAVKNAGVPGAAVVLTDSISGSKFTATSNDAGGFTVNDVPVGRSYIVSATAKAFVINSQVIQVDDDVTGLTLTATTVRRGR